MVRPFLMVHLNLAPRLLATTRCRYKVPFHDTILTECLTASTSRYRHHFHTWRTLISSRRNLRYELRKTRRPVQMEKLWKKKPILLVKRLIDSRGQHEGTQIEIYHEELQMFLAEIHCDVQGIDLTTKNPSVSPLCDSLR